MENNCECKKAVKSFAMDFDLVYKLFTYYCVNQNNELVYIEVNSEDFLEIIDDLDLVKINDEDLVVIDYLKKWFKSNDVFMVDTY